MILREIDGVIMTEVPPALPEMLNLSVGSTVSVEMVEGRVIIKPSHPRYTAEELLADYEPEAERSAEDEKWLNSPPVGRELI